VSQSFQSHSREGSDMERLDGEGHSVELRGDFVNQFFCALSALSGSSDM
jgi:hypothetical protein